MTKHFDQIIIGAVISGASIAFELSKKGYKTLVVDKLADAGCGPDTPDARGLSPVREGTGCQILILN